MHKHLSTFLYVTIGSFSFASIAMDGPEPISQREFRNRLPRQLTQEEQENKKELFGILAQGLAAQFAAVRGISIVNGPEQIIEPAQEESILYTNNRKPSEIAANQIIDEECIKFLKTQIDLAHKDSDRQNAAKQALKQEKARIRQIALAARKKVTAPGIMKDVVASTFAMQQSVQAATPAAASTLVTPPTFNVSVNSITKAVVCYPEPIPQETPPAAPSYEDLDALLESVEAVTSKPVVSSIPSKELDELLADLECSPQVANPLYQEPLAYKSSKIENAYFEKSAVDISPKIQELYKLFVRVAKTAEQFGAATPNIPEDFTYDLADLDKLSDELAPVLRIKSENEYIPALARLQELVASVQETDLAIDNPAIKRMISYKSYAASLKSLNGTLALAK